MKLEEFEKRLNALKERYREFMRGDAPHIAGNAAVNMFKENFQDEGFFGNRWKEVKRNRALAGGRITGNQLRRISGRKRILTGRTGDLGRSIEVKQAGNGRATIWTNPAKFAHSGKVYAKVHNEGLRAGRGAGFTMPRRQFIGMHAKLNSAIIKELEKRINAINRSL